MKSNNREEDRQSQSPNEVRRKEELNPDRNRSNSQAEESSAVHFGDSTYQTKEEFEKDKSTPAVDSRSTEPSDLSDDSLGDRIGQTDRSGTSELSSQQNSETSNLSSSSNASAEPGM